MLILALCWACFVATGRCFRETHLHMQMKEQVMRKMLSALATHNDKTVDVRQQQQDGQQQQQEQQTRNLRDYSNDIECYGLPLVGDIHAVSRATGDLHIQCGLSEFRNDDRLFPTQRWNFIPFNRPTLNLTGRINDAILKLHKTWLVRVAEVALVYCSETAEGTKLGQRVYIRSDSPKSVSNRWNEYDVGALFNDQIGGTTVSLALAYRNKKTAHSGTPVQFTPHLDITLCQRHLQVVNVCHGGNRPQPCCLQEVEIDFEKENWHFMHSPKKLILHACRGYCQYYLSNEADTRQLFDRFINGTRLPVGTLCCVADGYQPVVVQTNTPLPSVVRSLTLQNVDVSSCSCKV